MKKGRLYSREEIEVISKSALGKSLNDLELEEIAYLAALPKGPNNYNPKTKYDAF